jgi:ATP-binding cassette subfamily C protein
MRMSIDLLKHYLYAPLTFHLQRNSADLIRNAQVEIQTMNNNFIVPVLKAATQIFITSLIFVTLLLVNPIVSILSITILIIAIYIYYQWVKKYLLKNRDILQKARGLQLKSINQALGSIKELKVLQRETQFLNIYKKVMQAKHHAIVNTQTISRLNAPYLEFISLMGMLLIALLVAISGASTDQIAAILAFYGLAMFRLKQSVGIILDGYTAVKVNHITIRPIFDDMKTVIPPTLSDKKGHLSFKNSVLVENIEFKYPGSKQNSLHNINLTIKKGESIGFVGSTGAGKTTLIDILLGLLVPQQGRITIDGINLHDSLISWHQLIGYVPQQIFLLDDTIRANVTFGLLKEEVDDKLVWQALEAAQLASFVNELPDGLDTLTGERGIRLSGGQRQRIGIARALYHKPSVIVMDEATAALDNKTEKMFVEALENLSEDHTIIIIAHRISTVKNCDKIILMENGEIIEQGTYDELICKSSIFQELAK